MLIRIAIMLALTAPVLVSAKPNAKLKPRLVALQGRTGNALYDRAIANGKRRRVGQIVNGILAASTEFPWQVSLGTASQSDAHYAHFCGGAIYTRSWVITAAHCVEKLAPQDLTVAAGAIKLDGSTTRHSVDRIVLEPAYVDFSLGKDVALLHLTTPLSVSATIKPIPLVSDATEASFVNNKTPLIATGWGADETGGLTLSDLMKVPLPYVSNVTCSGPLSYPPDDATHKPEILNDMICAGYADGHADICEGDSGGPLVFGTGTSASLVGLASFSAGCAAPYKYAVFARASRFRAWIDSVTRN